MLGCLLAKAAKANYMNIINNNVSNVSLRFSPPHYCQFIVRLIKRDYKLIFIYKPHISSDIHHISSDIHHISSDIHHISSDIHHISSDIHHISSDIHHISSDKHHISTYGTLL